MRILSRSLLLCALTLTLAVPVWAAPAPAAEAPSSLPNKPVTAQERDTPVAVEYEGTDSIGSRLATRVKELLNSSNLFSLTEKDTPKIRVLISSTPEFSTRPEVGSAYCVVWLFAQSEATLRHFLVREVGVMTPGEVNDVAAKIVERTDGLAVRYGYLF